MLNTNQLIQKILESDLNCLYSVLPSTHFNFTDPLIGPYFIVEQRSATIFILYFLYHDIFLLFNFGYPLIQEVIPIVKQSIQFELCEKNQ